MTSVAYSASQRTFLWPEMAGPALVALRSHWARLTEDGKPPARSRFSPIGLPGNVWPHLFLVEFLEGAGNYRLRLMGGYLVAVYGRDFSGHRMVEDEIPGIAGSTTVRLLGEIAATGLPQYCLGPTKMRFRDVESVVEQVLLPLANEATGRIEAAVGAANYPTVRNALFAHGAAAALETA